MAFDRKDMTGALFENDKQGNEKRPDWRGSILIDGKTWYVSAWEQVAQSDGKRYLSLKIGAPQESRQGASSTPSQPARGYDWKSAEKASPVPKQPATAAADFDDDIPF